MAPAQTSALHTTLQNSSDLHDPLAHSKKLGPAWSWLDSKDDAVWANSLRVVCSSAVKWEPAHDGSMEATAWASCMAHSASLDRQCLIFLH
eukprot:m.368827 g.368827  ORF g.368827 m.368827 type:complete len:91 (+) comp16670_c0_seq3:1344-1616(+)